MVLKIMVVVLAILALAEFYLIAFRHPNNRFKQIDEDGYIALDTATGQLCVTVKRFPPKDAPNPSDKVLVIRNMPTCADLR